MSKLVNASTLRNNLADAFEEVGKKEKFLLITRNDQVVSALVDIDFFEDLLAKTSKGYLKSIQEARKQFEKGEVTSHAEVFGKL